MERKLDDWTKALKDAATAGSGERLPDELWQRISARLDAVDGKPAGRRGRIYAWTASAAAAAAVVFLGIFLLRTPAGNGPDDTTAADTGPLPVDTAIPAGITEAADTPGGTAMLLKGAHAVETPALPRLSAAATASATPKSVKAVDIYNEPDAAPDAAVKKEIRVDTGDIPANKESYTIPARIEKAGNGAASAAEITPAEPGRRVNKRSSSGLRGGLLAFSGGGIGYGSGSSGKADLRLSSIQSDAEILMPARNTYMVSVAASRPAPDPEQYSYRHRQPLTFAVVFDLPVGHNLYAGAGVSYTKLSSTATSKVSGEEFDQRLQYIGIPLTFTWAFLNTRFVTLYTGAGVQPEFCVDARFGGEKADVSTMQWSASLLAGAQLNLGKHVGIYAEPKLSHYFLETALETVRNTKSVNFNLEFGLRFRY